MGRSNGGGGHRQRRCCLDVGGIGVGPRNDGSGTGVLLWRASPQQECHQHDGTGILDSRCREPGVAPLRFHAVVRPRSRRRHRRIGLGAPHGRRSGSSSVYAPAFPLQAFMLFQLMFAAFTPALIAGAFAERIKFGAMLLFAGLWSVFVYTPIAHWMWGNGWLARL